MRFSRKLAIIFVRPVYRVFFEKPLWWFLARVKAYFFAEVGVQLGNIERRLALDHSARDWAVIDERLRRLETNNTAQWDALEQLLLAMFRQQEFRSPVALQNEIHTAVNQAADNHRVHAASNLR